MKIEFFAAGVPAPGGSKTAIPMYDGNGKLVTKPTESGRQRPVLRYVDDAKGNAAWRKIVGWIGKSTMQHKKLQALEGPLRFSVEFLMPRGVTVKRADHTVKPDLSKLIRSTEDALTSIVWIDDAQIVEHGPMRKRYITNGESPGAKITIELLGAQEQLLELAAASPPETHPHPPAPTFDDKDSPFD